MFNNISFILHKPQLSENIGACARAIKNFNFEKLILVDPKPSFPNDKITPLFEATVHTVEESIINAMIAAETMEGINNNKAYALPHDTLIEVLKKYNRLK